jgi:hypothetical protein
MKSLAQVEILTPNCKIHLENIIWLGWDSNPDLSWSGLLACLTTKQSSLQMNFAGNDLLSGYPGLNPGHLIFLVVNLVIFCLPVSRWIVPKITEFYRVPILLTKYSKTSIQRICWDRKNHDFAVGGFVVWWRQAGCVYTGAPGISCALHCKSSKFLNLVFFHH